MSKYDIFVSYSRVDAHEVFKCVDRLRAEGFSVWIDSTGIESGDAFKKVIFDAIEQSEFFLFFSSKHSNASTWTAKEIGVAVSLHKTIIPIRLDSSQPTKEVLFDIVNLDYCDFTNTSSQEDEFQNLISSIRHKLPLSKSRIISQEQGISKKWPRFVLFAIGGLCIAIVALLFLFLSDKELIPLNSKRGRILDEFGRPLAFTELSYDLFLNRSAIPAKNKNDYYRDLSGLLADIFGDKNAYQYYSQLSSLEGDSSQLTFIAGSIPDSVRVSIESSQTYVQRGLSQALVFQPVGVRQYPFGNLAKAYIGHLVEQDDSIKNTLESVYNRVLSGTTGYVYERTLFHKEKHPVDGLSIRTTLSADFQEFGTNALRDIIEQDETLAEGALVIMEVSSGEIKAIVNLTKDIESGTIAEKENFICNKQFEPGSSFKTVTLLSALTDGLISSPNDSIPTNHGYLSMMTQDMHIVDYERSYGKRMISIQEGFNMSSNYVFGYLGSLYQDNPQSFFDNIKRFGFNSDNMCSGFSLPSPSIIAPDSPQYSSSSLLTTAYGYGVVITPLHLIRFYNSIANYGKMVQPLFIIDYEKDGVCQTRFEPEVVAQICSKETAQLMINALYETTYSGTARPVNGFHVAGKTGTSRIAFNKAGHNPYYDDAGNRVTMGSFTGFFPVEHPQYTIFVYISSFPSARTSYGSSYPAVITSEIVQKLYEWNPSLKTDAVWNISDTTQNL